VGHIDGSKRGQYRYELELARQLGKGGDVAKNAAAEAARSKRPRRYDLRPIRDPDIFEGLVESLEKDPAQPKAGRLVVDIGGRSGVVDLAQEPRYTRGPKPLTVDRFRPGDLVRVRLAPERRRTSTSAAGQNGKPGPEPLALELGPQAAMVVLDPRSRELLALVGGYNYRPGGWDRTQRALRQAGSAFKPFVFAAAIESRKLTAASVLIDAPEVYESVGEVWKPQNYEKESYKGRVRLRTALAESLNTVAIRVANDVGLPAIISLAERAGITTPMPRDVGLSLALGANSVSPLELANAFATFPAGGQRQSWRLITEVNGEEQKVTEEPVAAFRPETAYVMTSIMKSVISEGTGKGAARVGRPVAGKTGTSSDEKDAWFVGFSPDLLAAIWVGFDDGKPLGKGEAGGRTAVPIWADFMTRALADRPTRDFTPPPGVEVVRIDPASGLLPPPGAEGVEEVFLQGTAPRETAVSTDEAATADKLLFQDGTPAPAPAPTP
jgi:penicillin-binding protein 1A